MAQATAAGSRPLTPEEVGNLLRAVAESMRTELSELPEDVAGWHPAPGEWCVKECLGHMMEAEARGFAGRIRRIVETPGLFEPDWDQVQVQRDRHDDDRPLAELLESFLELRAASLELVAGLMNTDLTKTCTHAVVGELKVEDLLQEWVHHDHNHLRQVMAGIQAFVWPWMGNAQKFSQPS